MALHVCCTPEGCLLQEQQGTSQLDRTCTGCMQHLAVSQLVSSSSASFSSWAYCQVVTIEHLWVPAKGELSKQGHQLPIKRLAQVVALTMDCWLAWTINLYWKYESSRAVEPCRGGIAANVMRHSPLIKAEHTYWGCCCLSQQPSL